MCPICERTFIPRRGDQRYCRSACRQRAYRLRRQYWYGDEYGNVYINGKVVGTITPPFVAWEATGLERQMQMRMRAAPNLRPAPTGEHDATVSTRDAAALLRMLAAKLDPDAGRLVADAALALQSRADREARHRAKAALGHGAGVTPPAVRGR
jgi:hypothetical protein